MNAILRPIVIADDSPEDVELTCKSFERARVANPVLSFRDGVELMEYLEKVEAREQPAPLVILLDVKMPRMDGVEALRALRSRAALKAIPVIMLTSSQAHTDLLQSYDLGANGYVVKPVDITQFRAAIEAISVFWVLTNTPPPA